MSVRLQAAQPTSAACICECIGLPVSIFVAGILFAGYSAQVPRVMGDLTINSFVLMCGGLVRPYLYHADSRAKQ